MLKAWLIQATTMPDLQATILLQRITAWKQLSARSVPMYTWPGVNKLVKQQDQLGWRVFLEGCILKEWAAKQQ
jgi:hypothetical protein